MNLLFLLKIFSASLIVRLFYLKIRKSMPILQGLDKTTTLFKQYNKINLYEITNEPTTLL